MTSVEINSGGFLPPIHLPVDELRASEDARQEYLGEFSSRGLTLTALNCNGNPLFPREGFPHAKDLEDSIELAALLGVKRVITMSGAPAGSPSGTNMAWNPLPWWSPLLDVRDHQWGVAVPYWKEIQARAADADVRVGIEMHPGNIVFNPSSMHRLAEEIGSTHVGAEMDPSHLFWQGIDPVLAVKDLGELVVVAAAKDTRINEAAKVNGVLDDRFTRVAEGEPGYLPLGGGTTLVGLAEQPLVGLRGRRSRARRVVVDRVPAGAARRRPRHAGQHRARGPGARPARGPDLRREHPARGREGAVTVGAERTSRCGSACSALPGSPHSRSSSRPRITGHRLVAVAARSRSGPRPSRPSTASSGCTRPTPTVLHATM